ncbi:hypothetical protein PHYSODRAFT_305045 [Phytophthora sojae]|uniref:Uncharacterized protein n=1 Tax=Phytophthora sojae (strain P6497) TaxID=1094619 RepID=G5A4D6_PHYSP|nr:hypothetical protein PHYSODRAFT_305045 [Phytophthora sojae]EGZ09537.1 hypothetical protein PHYSODRAFT_305045 [Phytophthora sojae]|eukprot:XP_009534398.1 hypothetical protein PHYSODRAFT_305045 [Phytophthora sojae]
MLAGIIFCERQSTAALWRKCRIPRLCGPSIQFRATTRSGSTGATGSWVKTEVPTARPQENIGLRELWRYSGLISTQPPPDGTLSKVFQRRLSFRVRIQDEQIADVIFAKNGLELRCDDLSSLIDVLIMSREAYERGDATRHPSRGSNDKFFGFTEQICQANGFQLRLRWGFIDSKRTQHRCIHGSAIFLLAQWHGSGYCHGRICWENMVGNPLYSSWTLVNMQTSRKSNLPKHTVVTMTWCNWAG